jgi:hypothetical protein
MGGLAASLVESDALLVGDTVGDDKKLAWFKEGSTGKIER